MTGSWNASGVRSEQQRGGDEPAEHDDARDHHGDARSRQGFAFADRGVRRPPSASCQGSGHDTRHDQQDPNRLPRPMERLPRQEPCGCDAGGDECERRPKPRKIPFTVPARPDEIAIKTRDGPDRREKRAGCR
jgi:hypothetical protein